MGEEETRSVEGILETAVNRERRCRMLGFILLLFILTSIWVGMMSAADVEEIKKNWPKYRCRPSVMPFASLYGHPTAENFNFCLNNMFGTEMAQALGPVFQILGTIVTTLVTLVEVANSLRVQFATMMGGINGLFQNFADRFKQLMSTVQMSVYRIKLLMGRLYGTFFALIYMSIAGMTAMTNFTDSVLFDFLDTFCFDPDTPVEIVGKGSIAVKDVVIGDVFERTGSRVTAAFQFAADGQAMVELPGGILVSTNHYVYSLGKWIHAGEHPHAVPKGPWTGGHERPLICFNTSDHQIPIGHFTFLDYDETEEGDQETMAWIETRLNGVPSNKERSYLYTTCFHPSTYVVLKDGSQKRLDQICLGDELSTGRVVGVLQKETDAFCKLSTGERVAPGSAVWKETSWVRAGDLIPPIRYESPQIYRNLVVLGTASLETASGVFLRDYVEVHSPDSEQFYAKEVGKSVNAASCVLAE